MRGLMPSKRIDRKPICYPGVRMLLNGGAKGPVLIPSMFGNDEGDVVVLLVGAEALDFIDDRSKRSL